MVDGELQDALVRVDGSGEWACKTTSGRIFFFPQSGIDPASITEQNPDGTVVEFTLADHVKKHNKANSEKPVLAEDVDTSADEEWDNWGVEPDEESADAEKETMSIAAGEVGSLDDILGGG